MRNATQRGALIIFEGCDRSGKTTICNRLVKHLSETLPMVQGELPAAKMMRFPERETEVGKMIDAYLRSKNQLNDQVIHLLFSANRWEKSAEITKALESGQNVIIDRYAFSGVAFSAAKEGLSLEWCRQPDRGLPKPDLVCFLDVSPEEAAKRGGFGNERYETQAFQDKVRANYKQLIEDNWKIINTDGKSLDQVYDDIRENVNSVLLTGKRGKIEPLWPLSE